MNALAQCAEGLYSLAAPSRLRAYDVPREHLPSLSETIAKRAPVKANPRPAPAPAIRELLEEIS